jgi:hypothetical protein
MYPKSFPPETVPARSFDLFLPAEWSEAVGRARFRGLARYSADAVTSTSSRSSFEPLNTALL